MPVSAAPVAVPSSAGPGGEVANDAAESGVQPMSLGPTPADLVGRLAAVVHPGPVGPVAPTCARIRWPRRAGPRGPVARGTA